MCMFRIKFPTKRTFRIFPILRTDGMAPFGTYLWNDPRTSKNYHDLLNLAQCYSRPQTFTLSQDISPWHLVVIYLRNDLE